MNERYMPAQTSAAPSGGVPMRDTYDGPSKKYGNELATDREAGSVQREMNRLSEAVGSLEHCVGNHVSRIQGVMLMTGGVGGSPSPQAPDVAVCDVAEGVRTLRRRLEEITAALAGVTQRVDL